MANNCLFDMKITGPEEAVRELVSMLKDEHPTASIGRVFSFDVDEELTERAPGKPNIISVTGIGDCAWSMYSSMRDGLGRVKPLDSVVENLGLAVEAYSSEPGIGFQEHLLIVKGDVKIDDCVDYEEHLIDGASEEYINKLLEEKHLTREELMSQVNCNGELCFGGFDNYGDFSDLFQYFPEKEKASLDQKIAQANEKASTAYISNVKALNMEIE